MKKNISINGHCGVLFRSGVGVSRLFRTIGRNVLRCRYGDDN